MPGFLRVLGVAILVLGLATAGVTGWLVAGDAHFREKANAKMAELRESARAMFLVSHGLASIAEMCNECIWLDKGRLMMRGAPDEVIEAYMRFVKVKKSATTTEDI